MREPRRSAIIRKGVPVGIQINCIEADFHVRGHQSGDGWGRSAEMQTARTPAQVVVHDLKRTLSVVSTNRMRVSSAQLHLIEKAVHDPAVSAIQPNSRLQSSLDSSTINRFWPDWNRSSNHAGASVYVHAVKSNVAGIAGERSSGRIGYEDHQRL